jgi:exopolyphosphatase / guanosine-5'-triphosphate,3'-diphosphate pyrophosphatase
VVGATSVRVGVIDCGTNAIRLLIADVDDAGVKDRVRTMRTVRLGEGVDSTGEFSAAALERTFQACREYAELIADARVERVRFVATSASRDVTNRRVFIEGVHDILNVTPEVISGQEEATLSFTGALMGLPEIHRPVLVVDIGGGSTEFVFGDAAPQAIASVDMGCVRMTERHIRSDPPTQAQMDQIRTDVHRLITQAGQTVPLHNARTLVGLAGSVTTVAAMAMDLSSYDAELIHGSVIARPDVERVAAQLAAMSSGQRAALPFMHPGRVDVIASGAAILAAVMSATQADTVVVSEHDILDGMAAALAAD